MLGPLALTLEKQARKLSRAEQEWLAGRLLAPMEDEGLTAVDEAWVREAERRLSAWKSKKTKPIPAAKALADSRRELGARRF